MSRRLLTLFALSLSLTGLAGLSPVRADSSSEHRYRIPATASPGLQAFLKLETSAGVFNIDYHYGRVTPGADGAYLQNVGSSPSSWYIEDQRYGNVDVIAGVLHDDMDLVKTGLEMFDFGLDREAKNGSFPGSFGLFHGTAMFLSEAAPAMLVLQSWAKEPYLGKELDAHISWEISRMSDAARYLVQAWWGKRGHIDD